MELEPPGPGAHSEGVVGIPGVPRQEAGIFRQAQHGLGMAGLDPERFPPSSQKGVSEGFVGKSDLHGAQFGPPGIESHLTPQGVRQQLVAVAHPQHGKSPCHGFPEPAGGLFAPGEGVGDHGMGPGHHRAGNHFQRRQGFPLRHMHDGGLRPAAPEFLGEPLRKISPTCSQRRKRAAGLDNDNCGHKNHPF